jgi:hypothetical protein
MRRTWWWVSFDKGEDEMDMFVYGGPGDKP